MRHLGSIFSINHETLRRLQAPESAVKLPESSGGGYMAVFEYVHYLHCLVSDIRSPLTYTSRLQLAVPWRQLLIFCVLN